MDEPILFRAPGEAWRRPADAGYAGERELQSVHAEHPSLIPGVGSDAAVCTEFRSAAGPADLLIVNGEGAITLVECKLAGNPQVRREIIGQLLDYASQIWRTPVDHFATTWSQQTGRTLWDQLDGEEEELRAALGTVLAEGRFTLVLAVDRINGELRRIVEYLNRITDPAVAVIAVEFDRYADSGVEVLLPRTYGSELVEAKRGPSGSARRWTVEEYRNWLEQEEPDSLVGFALFAEMVRAAGHELHGSAAASPSLGVKVSWGKHRRWPINLLTQYGNVATFDVRFVDLKGHDRREEFLDALSGIAELGLDAGDIRSADFGRKPKVPLTVLRDDQVVADLVRSLAILQGSSVE
jgi:hypothetical protein